jgi:beta-lactamase regulating signal transducer with metallopeptidase domain/thiol-disulfide isomerase/thioredoxin/protocatechuate 3,4-dioxygenase beta subunit
MNSTTLAGHSFSWVLQSSWQAAVLVLLVLIVQMIFRRKLSPAWRYGLWLLVVLRLLMPASPQSAISIFNLAKFTPRQPIAAPPALSRMEAPGIPMTDLQPLTPDEPAFLPSAPRTKVQTTGAASTMDLRPNRPTNWFGIACAIWLLGIGLLAVRLVWANVRFSLRLSRRVPVRDATIIRLVEHCAIILRLARPVIVLETEEVDSPAVCGLWKKKLLAPDGTFERFSSEELRHIFLHEMAHIKRRDIEVNWLTSVLQILHWFNPVLWLAFARMRADRELATDALALTHVPTTENVPYGETILKVVEHLARGAVQPGLVGIAEGKAGLKERLRAIARRGAAKPWRWAAIGMAALVAGIGLTGAQENHPPFAADQAAHTPNQRNFALRVSDYDNGTPLAGVTVSYTLDYFDGKSIKELSLTDQDGRAALQYVPSDLQHLAYAAEKSNYLTLNGEWFDQELSLLGEEYPVKLGQGAEIGGSVVDENGKPVIGAEISFDEPMRMLLSAGYGRTDHAELWIVPSGQRAAVTGANGTWKAKCIWPGIQWASLRIHHPDFADATCSTDLTSAMQAEGKGAKVSFDDLTNHTVRLTLTKGVAVHGRVINETGTPLSGQQVSYAELLSSTHAPDQLLGRRTVITDANGKFQISHVPQKHLFFLVQTAGYAPLVAELDPKEPDSSIELRLAMGTKMAGEIKDSLGNPVDNAHIAFADFGIWRGVQWETVSDSNGRFEWDNAPDEKFQLQIEKDGFITQQKTVDLSAGGHLVVQLNRTLRIAGKVLDAETGEPIKQFQIDWLDRGNPGDFAEGYPFSTIPGSNGVYSLDVGRLYAQNWFGGYAHQCVFRVEADGYAAYFSRVFSSHASDVGEVSCNINLKRTPQISGTVIDAEGRPVAGAQVALRSPASRLFILGGPTFSGPPNPGIRLTDAQGRFQLTTDPAQQGIIAIHDEGFAELVANSFSSNITLKLQPWGRIEGTVWEYDHPVTNQEITATGVDPARLQFSPRIYFQTNTDVQGRFAFDLVPPGKYYLNRMIPIGSGASSGPHEVIEVQPGETASVKVGGVGRPIVGQMKITNPYLPIDWSGGRNYFYAQSISPRPPTNFTTREQIEAWQNQPEIQKARAAIRNYPMKMDADGSFRMDEVTPGKYEMQIEILDPRDPNAMAYSKYIARATKAFEVPQSDAREPLDIGVFEISLKPDLKTGQTGAPEFEATDMAGKSFKLSDYRGKYALLDFWATWCGPCIGEIPYLKQAHEKFKDRGDFAMISLSLDKTINEPREFLKKNDLPWVQGYLGDWSETKVAGQYGVEGIPALFLVSPDGKIIESELEGSSIISRIEKHLK